MKPRINATVFGFVVVDGVRHQHDVILRLSGKVKKRKKRLSREVYGTSHVVSLAEAKHVHQKGAKRLVVGTGHQGMVKLSEEAAEYFQRKGCEVQLLPTPEAALAWNRAKGEVIGLFHVTC
jgi:hypothetical protein